MPSPSIDLAVDVRAHTGATQSRPAHGGHALLAATAGRDDVDTLDAEGFIDSGGAQARQFLQKLSKTQRHQLSPKHLLIRGLLATSAHKFAAVAAMPIAEQTAPRLRGDLSGVMTREAFGPSARLPVLPATQGARMLSEAFRGGSSMLWKLAPHKRHEPLTLTVYTEENIPEEHVLAGMPHIPNGMWLTKKDGNLFVRDETSFPGRNLSLTRLLSEMADMFPRLSDFEPVYMCTHGLDVCLKGSGHNRIPAAHVLAIHAQVSGSLLAEGQRLHLVPDNTFDHWQPTGVDDFDATCTAMHLAGGRPAKHHKAGWIGNLRTNPIRSKLVNISESRPDLIEAIDSKGWKQVEGQSGVLTNEGKNDLSMPDQVRRWAYLIDVEGVYSSFRLKYLFHSQRPVLMQERRFIEYWNNLMEPWVHYVPIKQDLSDLVERVEWLKAEPDAAAAIADQALEFAQEHLTRLGGIDRLAHVFDEISESQAASPPAA